MMGPPQGFNQGYIQGRGGFQNNQMYRQKGGYQGPQAGMTFGFGGPLGGMRNPNAPPPVKKDFSQYYSLYVGNLSNITFDQDLFKFF